MKKYEITLKHWITRKTVDIQLAETIKDAKEKLKEIRKTYKSIWWIKHTPIHCK